LDKKNIRFYSNASLRVREVENGERMK